MPVPSNMPPKAQRQWEDVYQSALERNGGDESNAAKQAWGAVKKFYKKDRRSGFWVPRKHAKTHVAVRGRMIKA
jgi:cation transport regulator ChaB